MKKIITMFLSVMMMLCIAIPTFAQDKDKIETGKCPNGDYQIKENVMLINTIKPVMIDRFSAYGYLEQDKKGMGVIENTDAKDKLAEGAFDLRAKLLSLQSKYGLWLLRAVVLQNNNQIVITKNSAWEWSELKKDIFKIMEDWK